MIVILILKSIYFIFPAYVANMLPSMFSGGKFLHFLKIPVDSGIKVKGMPLLGKNKTIRGFLVGILGAMLFALIQRLLYPVPFFNRLSLFDYTGMNVLMLGFLLGFGALLGDALESCIKRRLNLKPGTPFIPWDQLDYVVGALLLVSLLYVPPASVIVTILIVTLPLHILVNVVAYMLKLKSVWW